MKQNKYDVLKDALKKAVLAAENAAIAEDGGTCNFDSPVILYKKMKYQPKKALQVIESLGLQAWIPSSKYWKGCLVVSGMTRGQGYCRTLMAEAFANSLKQSNIESGVYYQMD